MSIVISHSISASNQGCHHQSIVVHAKFRRQPRIHAKPPEVARRRSDLMIGMLLMNADRLYLIREKMR